MTNPPERRMPALPRLDQLDDILSPGCPAEPAPVPPSVERSTWVPARVLGWGVVFGVLIMETVLTWRVICWGFDI